MVARYHTIYVSGDLPYVSLSYYPHGLPDGPALMLHAPLPTIYHYHHLMQHIFGTVYGLSNIGDRKSGQRVNLLLDIGPAGNESIGPGNEFREHSSLGFRVENHPDNVNMPSFAGQQERRGPRAVHSDGSVLLFFG